MIQRLITRSLLNLAALAALLLCASHDYASQRDLNLYSPAARSSIMRGLADGTVTFEPSASGGEYIARGRR